MITCIKYNLFESFNIIFCFDLYKGNLKIFGRHKRTQRAQLYQKQFMPLNVLILSD